MEIEALAGAADGPSMIGAVLRLAAFAALLAAGAIGWLFWRRRGRGAPRQLEVLDRVLLTRGASIALLRVADRRLLVGVSSEGVRLIKSLGVDESFSATLAHARSLEEPRP